MFGLELEIPDLRKANASLACWQKTIATRQAMTRRKSIKAYRVMWFGFACGKGFVTSNPLLVARTSNEDTSILC